jgi:hypothetical protein
MSVVVYSVWLDMRMVFGLNGHVDDVNVIFGIYLWCFKVLSEVRAVYALYWVLLGLNISIAIYAHLIVSLALLVYN